MHPVLQWCKRALASSSSLAAFRRFVLGEHRGDASPARAGPSAHAASGQRTHHAPYLSLLHLYSPDVQEALDELLREPLASVNRVDFHHKLANDDWRYSIEAAVRLVDAYGGRRQIRPGEGSTRGDSTFERDLEVLWWRIEQGSWVMPQLVVVALVIDPSFCARAGGILDARVTLRSNAVAITARDREDAVAHANSVAMRDGKTVASLIAALRIAGKPVSMEGDSDRARTLRRLLAGDVHECELIVQDWHRSLLESFVVRGKNL